MSALPVPAPHQVAEAEPYWAGLREERLVLQRCDACSTFVWFPRVACPSCGVRELAWKEVSGRGTIYSYAIVRQALGDYAGATPYVLAYVELDEGPRVMTNIVGPNAIEEIEIGHPVEVVFHRGDGGSVLARFVLRREWPIAPAGSTGDRVADRW